jgi:hypothetical protein
MTAGPATESNEAAHAALCGAGGTLMVRCEGGRADGVMHVHVPDGFQIRVGDLWELRAVAGNAAEGLPADNSRRLGDPHPSKCPWTAEQAIKMRDGLREIDQILESSKWYDDEDERESLLARLGSIVQGALP